MDATMASIVTITLDDMVEHGTLDAAIRYRAESDAGIYTVVYGDPASVRSAIRRAKRDGVYEDGLELIDVASGRIGQLDDETGCIDWTASSCVEIECPELDQAILEPVALRSMVAGLSVHSSDQAAWRGLVEGIRSAAAAVADVQF